MEKQEDTQTQHNKQHILPIRSPPLGSDIVESPERAHQIVTLARQNQTKPIRTISVVRGIPEKNISERTIGRGLDAPRINTQNFAKEF